MEPPYLPDHAAFAAVEKYDDRFLDREILAAFQPRAPRTRRGSSLPLLERVRFLAIFTSNLDEFFMVRVAGLKRRIAAGVAVRAASGLLPREVLEAIWTTSRELMKRHASLFRDEIVPALSHEGIELVLLGRSGPRRAEVLQAAVQGTGLPRPDPGWRSTRPTLYISGLSLNLAVVVRNPKTGKEHFARVKVPPIFARFVPLGNQRFVPLEDVIGEHLKRLFPGMDVLEVHTFRVTRNEDLEVEEDDAENLLAALGRRCCCGAGSGRRCGSRSRSRSRRPCWTC